MTKVQLIEVSEDDDNSRLDKWLGRRFPMLGHGLVHKLLRTGQIRVDGSRVRGGVRLIAGQWVRIPPLEVEKSEPKRSRSNDITACGQNLNSKVLFEDESIIALDKPSGLAVQGGTKQEDHIDNLSFRLVGEGEDRPRLVHRLDKDTSGVLLLAKTVTAARELTAAFRNNQVRKTYWAVVNGIPERRSGHIENRMQKIKSRVGERMSTNPVTGRLAITRYEVLDSSDSGFSLLGLYPLTGRTHQLRVHCADLETPIIGDKKYGSGVTPAELKCGSQLLLHARRIVLIRRNGVQLKIEAPIPNHIKECLSILRLSVPKRGA